MHDGYTKTEDWRIYRTRFETLQATSKSSNITNYKRYTEYPNATEQYTNTVTYTRTGIHNLLVRERERELKGEYTTRESSEKNSKLEY